MQAQGAIHEPILYAVIAVQIFQRKKNILTGGKVAALCLVSDVPVLGANGFADRFGEREPFAQVRHAFFPRQSAH